MRFAPVYTSCVLKDNFDHAKHAFLAPLMAIHRAHLVMLTEQGIVSEADGRALRDGLDSIVETDIRTATLDDRTEDLFTHVERLLDEACRGDAAGWLHTARSRNDIDMTMYRMRLREWLLELIAEEQELRRALIDVAAEHRGTLFAAHTHTQPAQPTTVAHYLLAVIEQLERDDGRLRAAHLTTNRNPLGACAITGTGFPIDRDRTSALLGFDGPTGNTYGSIATVDYLLEAVTATAVMLVGLGRVVQDLLLWCTAEFGYLRLDDGLVQPSSIMPQKRNPVALEHARAIGSKALGQSSAILLTVHNTPFGDIVDTEDDLQPLVLTMFQDALRVVRLVTASIRGATFAVDRLADGADRHGTTTTELADILVREHGLSFMVSHRIASGFAALQVSQPGLTRAEALSEASKPILEQPVRMTNSDLDRLLSARHFVTVRTTHGGPAPAETTRALGCASSALEHDEEWARERARELSAAEARLKAVAAAL